MSSSRPRSSDAAVSSPEARRPGGPVAPAASEPRGSVPPGDEGRHRVALLPSRWPAAPPPTGARRSPPPDAWWPRPHRPTTRPAARASRRGSRPPGGAARTGHWHSASRAHSRPARAFRPRPSQRAATTAEGLETIPTRMGNRAPGPQRARRPGDHPRVCREQKGLPCRSRIRCEPSPRRQGAKAVQHLR